MADIPFQTDIKVTIRDDRMTIQLSPTGDIQLVDGHQKLMSQLLRSIANDETSKRVLNVNVKSRNLTAYINLILRAFKQVQIDEVKKIDSSLSGYAIYRKSSSTDESYSLVSSKSVTWKFVDNNLENGIVYNYGISKIYENVFESSYIDKIQIAPSHLNQSVVIGTHTAAISGDGLVAFYVDFNRKFKKSELLNEIISISPKMDDNEPRKYSVDIQIKDLSRNIGSISTRRLI